jgi:hypothetical protein
MALEACWAVKDRRPRPRLIGSAPAALSGWLVIDISLPMAHHSRSWLVRPARPAETGDRAIDQLRIDCRQGCVIEAVFLQPQS